MRKPIEIDIYDTKISLWQDDPNDKTFYTDVYRPLVAAMQRRGWALRADPSTTKNYRCLSKYTRIGGRGDLMATVELRGRVIEVEFWGEYGPLRNQNGRRYHFDKRADLTFLDRLRVNLEMCRIMCMAEALAPVTTKNRNFERQDPTRLKIERDRAENRHVNHVNIESYNCTSRDGQRLIDGQTVWFIARGGRIHRGTAYHNINSMWWVCVGEYDRQNLSTSELYAAPPADLRRKYNDRARRKRLEGELTKAVQVLNFPRAQLVKSILFGDQQVWTIWSRKKNLWYAPNYSGYAADSIHAGKYTEQEAIAEAKRVPHILDAVDPNGKHHRFDKAA